MARAGMFAGLALAVVVGGTAVHQMAAPAPPVVPVWVQPAAPDRPAASSAKHKLPSGLLSMLTAPLRGLTSLGRGGGGGGGGSDRGDGGQ